MANRFYSTLKTYTGAGNTARDFKIYIDDSGFSGTATEFRTAIPGFNIQYESDYDKVTKAGIMASACTVPMLINSATLDGLITDLVDAEEGRFTVKITVNPSPAEELFWCGFILPDISKMQDVSYEGQRVFEIVATDGIGRLKDIDYNQTVSGNKIPYGYKTALEHILACLTDGPLAALYYTTGVEFIRTIVNWYESGHGTVTTAKDPLHYTQINGENFATRRNSTAEWDFMSKYDVLKQIALHFKARLFYSYGVWRFEQVNERVNTTLTERKWSRVATTMGSSAAISYEKVMDQTPDGLRLAGGEYGFLPALNEVLVTYDHRTAKNYLAGTGWKWYKGGSTTENAAITLSDLAFDADSIIKVSGRVKCKLTGPANTRWRYEFRMTITTNGGYIYRNLASNVDPNLNVIAHETGAWEISTVRAEISTDFQTTPDFEGYIPIPFQTPPLPAGTTSITIDFDTYGGVDNAVPENSVAVTLVDWKFEDLVLIIQNGDDANNFEYKRTYDAVNAITGNSKLYEFKELFGAAIKPWTPTKLRVSSNGSTWVDTTATWGRGAAGANEFGNLLATEILVGQTKPVMTFATTFTGENFSPHTRITTDDDGKTWLFMRGQFSAQMEELSGEWYNAGVNDGDDGGTIITTDGPPPDQPLISYTPHGSINPTAVTQLHTGSDLALSILAENYTSGVISSGAVTSIPVLAGIKANTYVTGDEILIVNPNTGKSQVLTVTANVTEGATAIAVSGTLTEAFPYSSIILTSKFVKSTTGHGGGSSYLPSGTTGQILRYGASNWAAFSGTSTGHVLTWNGSIWASAAPTTGVSDGDKGDVVVTSSGTVWTIDTNVVSDSKIRQSAGLSIIGRTSNTTGNIADIVAGTDGHVLRRSGAALAFGTVDTAGITNSAVTLAKIANIATARFLGRVTAGSGVIEELTAAQMQAALSMLAYTALVSGQVAYANGTGSITSSGSLRWDNTNSRLAIGTGTQASFLDIFAGSLSGTQNFITSSANVSGEMVWQALNAGLGNTLLLLQVAGTTAADPYLRLVVSGGSTWSAGIDNSDGDKLKIKPQTNPSTGTNQGMTITAAAASLVGINNDAPAYPLDVDGKMRARNNMGYNETWPAITFFNGAGTGATGSIIGSGNGCLVTITTGTTPTAGGIIANINLPTACVFATFCAVGMAPGNAQSATDVTKVYISGTANNNFTLRANGTLAASTLYSWYFTIGGY